MNRRVVTAIIIGALVCFGAGLLIGSVFLRKQVKETEGAGTPGALQPGSFSFTTSSDRAAANVSTNAKLTSQGAPPTTVADLEAAIHSKRSRWDLGKIYQVVDGLDTNQFAQAIAVCLKSTDQMTKYTAVHALAARWGEIDPQAALAYAQTVGNVGERIQVISGIVSGWAENDPSAAIAWAKQLPAGQTKNQALNAIASAVGTQDPHAIIALLR